MNWSPDDYDRLERAITDGSRVQLWRRGTELVLVPERLRPEGGGEVLIGRYLGTGDRLEVRLGEIDRFQVLD